jgi:hypothetical protein
LNGTWTAWSEITPRVFAPAGYGFGENALSRSSNVTLAAWGESYASWCAKLDAELATMDNYSAKFMIARGVTSDVDRTNPYQKGENCPAILYRAHDVDNAHLITFAQGQVAHGTEWRMQKLKGVWQPIEYVNPVLETNVEYRTTERLHEKTVYKKADSSRNIWYRLDGETTWYPYTSQVPSRYDFNNDSDGSVFNAAMDTLASSMLVGEARPIRFCDYPHLDGQTYVGTIYKHQSSYITITGAAYNGKMVIKTKNGSWSGWSEMYSSRRKPTPADIGAMDMDRLWTNTSPNVEFTAKTVSINLSNYQWVAIKYKLGHDKNYIKTVFGAIGDTLNMEMITDSHYVGKRKATTSTSSIVFEAATYSASVSNKQEYIIPLEVYGIKI